MKSRPETPAKRIAWQGLQLNVPMDWEVSGYSGDYAEGYLRVDDGEDVALEIKWVTVRSAAITSDNLTARCQKYLEALRTAASKRKESFVIVTNPKAYSINQSDMADITVPFSWKSTRIASGWIAGFLHSQRVVMAQIVVTSGKTSMLTQASSYLSSIRVDLPSDTRQRWAILDVDVSLPRGFKLVKADLLNVCVRLHFLSGSHLVMIEQWSAAQVARKDCYLDDWVRLNTSGPWRRAVARREEIIQYGDQSVVAVTGRVAFGAPLLGVVRQILQFRSPAVLFDGYFWHAETTNKMYAVQEIRPLKSKTCTWGVADSILKTEGVTL